MFDTERCAPEGGGGCASFLWFDGCTVEMKWGLVAPLLEIPRLTGATQGPRATLICTKIQIGKKKDPLGPIQPVL